MYIFLFEPGAVCFSKMINLTLNTKHIVAGLIGVSVLIIVIIVMIRWMQIAPTGQAGTIEGRAVTSDSFGIATGGSLQYMDDATRTGYFDRLVDLGVKRIRFDFAWSDIQSEGSDTYNWTKYDALVQAATDHNITILGMLGYTPEWARKPSCASTDKCPPANPNTYADFVKAAAFRYKNSGVHDWEIWNEPNITKFWLPQPNVTEYASMLRLAYQSIKSVDSSANVISGGLSPATNEDGNVAPIHFLQGMYSAGAKNSFDALGHHPYCYHAEFDCPVQFADWSAWSQMNDTSVSLRSTMISNGDENKQIWLTEFGAPTSGPNSVSEKTQADMLINAYSELSKLRWAGPLFVYRLDETGQDTNDVEDWFGLQDKNGQKKPSFKALQKLFNSTQ
jgi:polysaccharide biosynthesis protein PslG